MKNLLAGLLLFAAGIARAGMLSGTCSPFQANILCGTQGVPYTGAVGDVDLGAFQIKADTVTATKVSTTREFIGGVGGISNLAIGPGLATVGYNSYSGSYLAGVSGFGGLWQFSGPSSGVLRYYAESSVAAGSPHSHITALTLDESGATTVNSLTASTVTVLGQDSNGYSLSVSSGISAQCINLQGGQVCGPSAGGGGGGSPGGSSGNIQSNNGSGGFAGDANFTRDSYTLIVPRARLSFGAGTGYPNIYSEFVMAPVGGGNPVGLFAQSGNANDGYIALFNNYENLTNTNVLTNWSAWALTMGSSQNVGQGDFYLNHVAQNGALTQFLLVHDDGTFNIGGSVVWYYCSGGASDGLLARGNTNAALCPAGTWVATHNASN